MRGAADCDCVPPPSHRFSFLLEGCRGPSPSDKHHERAQIPYPGITGMYAPDIKISGHIHGRPKCQISPKLPCSLYLPPPPQIFYVAGAIPLKLFCWQLGIRKKGIHPGNTLEVWAAFSQRFPLLIAPLTNGRSLEL